MSNEEIIKIGVSAKSYPQYLFKYRVDNQNTEGIISKNQLWFSSPYDFNDPYDCNTPINPETSLSDIKKWLESVGIYSTHIDNLALQLQQNPKLMKESTEEVLKKTGVCCFSTIDDSILQWSHYSDYHRGICLKFDITEDPDLFIFPIIVSYRKVMPHYNHFTQSEKIIEYLIQPKFSEWAYESEVRIVKPENMIDSNGKSRAFTYKDSALKEIIFGVKTSEVVKEKYKNLCQKHNKSHVDFYEMELDSGSNYKLNKIKI